MTEQVDRLIDEALLEGDDSVTEAWVAEIHKRKSELRSGAVRAVPWSEARARLNAL